MRNVMVCLFLSILAVGWAVAAPVLGPVSSDGDALLLPVVIGDNVGVTRDASGDRIDLPGFFTGGAPGDPELPQYRSTLLLPEDVTPESVTATLEDAVWESVPGAFDVAPAPPAMTEVDGAAVALWGDKDPAVIVDGRDTSIYERDAAFPLEPVCTVDASAYRQWHLVHVTWYPVAYNPVQQRLSLLRSGVIRVSFTRTGVAGAKGVAPAGSDVFWGDLAADVANPADRARFYAAKSSAKDAPVADYVILTTAHIASLEPTFSEFVASRAQLGYTAAVITEGAVDDDAHYLTGASTLERAQNLRAWLQARYLAWGIRYVLLIGDPRAQNFDADTSVPMLMCYPFASDHAEDAPTDLCYAELSGDWDVDGDGYPGEYNQDFVAGGIDLNPELIVGRIPYWGVPDQLESILSKTIDYETDSGDVSWRTKLMTAAAISNFAEDTDNNGTVDKSPKVFGDTWGEAQKSLAQGYGYDTYTLYEKQGCKNDGTDYTTVPCDAPLTISSFYTAWLGGYGFVTWWGHGSAEEAWRKYWASDNYNVPPVSANDHIPQTGDGSSECPMPPFMASGMCSMLDNTRPSFVVQCSCTNGCPEVPNCVGYALLLNGAIATLSASRVSWYAVTSWHTGLGASNGDNASFGYFMFDRMAGLGDTVGEAFTWCQSHFGTGFGSSSWMNRMVFNIYGDPAATQNVDSLGVVPMGDTTFDGVVGRPFTSLSAPFTLSNGSSAALSWTASATTAWLDLSSAAGTLNLPGEQVVLTASVNENAATLAAGVYTDTVIITNTETGFSHHRDVTLDLRALDHFIWSVIPTPQSTYAPFEVALTAQTAAGDPVPGFDAAAGLCAVMSGALGDPLGLFPMTTGAFTKGVWHGAVMVLDPALSATLHANDGSGHTGASNDFEVVGHSDDCALGEVFDAQADAFRPLLAQLLERIGSTRSPDAWPVFDFEYAADWVAWVQAGQLGVEPLMGDGVPDTWQLSLLAEVLCNAWTDAKGNWWDYAPAVRAAFEANLAAWTQAVNDRLAEETDPDTVALLEGLRDDAGFLMAGMFTLSQDARDSYLALLAVLGIAGDFAGFVDSGKATNEPFHAQGDIDNDGQTNLEEYECVVSHGGDQAIFVKAALYNDPFWPNNPALPVTGGLGLALLVAACGAMRLAAPRRRRSESGAKPAGRDR